MHDLVFLFGVDNTLPDDDRIHRGLNAHLEKRYGARRYRALFEEERAQPGCADDLGALQRCRPGDLRDPRAPRIANWLTDDPFAARLCSRAPDVVRRAQQWGRTVILSDGGAAVQPCKVERSGRS